EREGREQRRRIVVIRGQDRAKSAFGHLGCVDPSRVASAANHVGGAEHDIVAMQCGLLRSLDRSREFRQAAAERAKLAPLFGAGVDPALGEPGDDLALGVEIVGLVTKMIAGVGAKPRPQALDALKDRSRILRSAQASFPRPWKTVVMPLASACRSLSSSATSMGNPTPGRGIICRSNASPWMSTIPGRIRRPEASIARSALACAPRPVIIPLSQSTCTL